MTQRIIDKAIAGLRRARYAWREPRQLRKARTRFIPRLVRHPLFIYVYSPTWNRADLLKERAVKTVLAQTHKDFKYLIVGDACTDDTASVESIDRRIDFVNLDKHSGGYPNTPECRWLCGPVGAANHALKIIDYVSWGCEWIARLDDDDEWSPDHLEKLLAFARAGNYEFVSSYHVEERNGVETRVGGEQACSDYYRCKIRKDGQNPQIGGTQTWLYRAYLSFFRYDRQCWRKAWNRVNDVDLVTRMYFAGVRMGFLPEVTAYVRPRPGETQVGLKAYLEAEK